MKENSNSLTGLWQGQYFDVRGYEGKLELVLENKADQIEGSFNLVLKDEDAPIVIAGKISGTMKEGSSIFYAKVVPLQKKQESVAIDVEILVSEAGSYAESAMYSSFSRQIHPDLKGGVWIAWKFRK